MFPLMEPDKDENHLGWPDDIQNETDILSYKKRHIYIGEFKNDVRQGKGRIIFND